MRRFGINVEVEASIFHFLESKSSLKNIKKFAESIQNLSDYFINPQSQETPWKSERAQEAYAGYFLPLGISRVTSVIAEGKRLNFFEGLDTYVDFGSGPGTVSFALQDIFKNGICVETSESAISLHKKLGAKNLQWLKRIEDYKKLAQLPGHIKSESQKTLLTMSYSLNELSEIPKWIFEFDAVMVLEPSTQKDFQRFSELRTQLIKNGWHIWAPCTHQGRCPLSGGRDWCHDRIEFASPSWWQEVEVHLPMKNRTITYSYLLARKDRPANLVSVRNELIAKESDQLARLVGDQLKEKGKTRQMVCRGEEREFLSWLHKEGEAPELNRGEYFVIAQDTSKHGNELRPKRNGS